MKRVAPLLAVAVAIAIAIVYCMGKKPSVCGENHASKFVHQLKYVFRDGKFTPFTDGGCPIPCPGNSPLVNAFPINGLDSTGLGACGPEQVLIERGTAGNASCKNGNLQFVDATGTIVIKNGTGETCAGSGLEGASFVAISDKDKVTFTIQKVDQVSYGGGSDGGQQGSATHEGYRIVASLKGDTAADGNTSVCDLNRSVKVRKALGLEDLTGDYTATVPGTGTTKPEPFADDVIAVPGPLYSNNVKPLSYLPNFFSLACATDALAKRTLDYVAKDDDSLDVRYAALRMLTATYCEKPRTARNMHIHFERGAGSGTGIPEAWWTAAGATCLYAPRLQQLGDIKKVQLGSDLIPPKCGKAGQQKCQDWMEWGSDVRDECEHPPKGEAPVTIPDKCTDQQPGIDYRSYVPTDAAPADSSTASDSGSSSASG